MKGISVIICCYNSVNRLSETLRHLALQEVSEHLNWEIILVDNNSTDDTISFAKKEWLKLGNSSTAFSIIEQPKQGLNFAREMGISCSRYDYLLFCDDDNWLFNDYIERSFTLMEDNDDIGVLGGQGFALPEIEAPPWIDLTSFATGPQAEKSGDITTTKTAVYGAASIFRKASLTNLYNNGFKAFLSDRKGLILSSGGDVELCWAISLSGKKIWYDENLKFFHFISADRLSFSYLRRMEFGNGYSSLLHVPYFELISKSSRKSIKNSWWWRFAGMLSILVRKRWKYAGNLSKEKQLEIIRYEGFLRACWKERKKYAKLRSYLKSAKWICAINVQ